jgi:hypothetical protein
MATANVSKKDSNNNIQQKKLANPTGNISLVMKKSPKMHDSSNLNRQISGKGKKTNK